MRKRGAPPLFELVSKPKGDVTGLPKPPPPRPAEPAPRHEPAVPEPKPLAQPVAKTVRPADPPADPDERRATLGGEAGLVVEGSRVTMPLPWAYLAIAVCLALVVGAYVAGHESGRGAAAADAADPPSIDIDDPLVVDIGVPPVESRRRAQTPSEPDSARQEPERPGPAQSSPPGVGLLHVAGAWTDDDPRSPNSNYLHVATLTRADAVEAVAVLGRGGVRAMAAPVDPGAGGPNSSGRFRVYSLGLAVPGARYSAMRGDRELHEAEVARIGAQWLGSGGAAGFARGQTQWVRAGSGG